MIRRSGATVLALVALAAAGCGGASSHHPVHGLPAAARVVYPSDAPLRAAPATVQSGGTVVASLPFIPSKDGFSFQNYGFIAGGDLDAHVMRELFGDAVCAGLPSDSCTLTPAAQNWAEQAAAGASGGHCYGFSMTALRFYEHNLNPQDFGGSSTYSLPFTHALQDEIAAAWSTYGLSPAQNALRVYTPDQMVSTLEFALAHPSLGLYTLTIWDADLPKRHAGHSVTPIGVKDLGGGRYQILIYDNNHPGMTEAISVDEHRDSWSYLVATTPAAPDGVWRGTGTSNEMNLIPVSTVTQRQPCPFCSWSRTVTVSVGGNPDEHGHLLITTSDGRRLGYLNGRFVNEILGARIVIPPLNQIWRAAPEPLYQIPSNDRFTVTLQGAGATGRDVASVYVSGPGFGATAGNLLPGPSSSYQLAVAPGQLQLRVLGSAATEQPTLQLASNQQRLTVSPRSLSPGLALAVRLSSAGRILLSASGTGTSTPLSLALQTVRSSGSRTVAKSVPPLSSGRQATFSSGLSRIG